MLRIPERKMDTDEKLCAFFIDWWMIFDHESWTTRIQTLKGNGIRVTGKKVHHQIAHESKC
jgi:hypothetical protein